MPDEGTVAWDDAVRGRIEFANENLADLVHRPLRRPADYNFASPVDDMLDGITHVIRGDDHVSNTPTQINILRALGADAAGLRARAEYHRRRRQEALEAPRRRRGRRRSARDGYLPAALMNFLALLGWSYDDKTTIMSPRRARRALLARARRPSPATFDYEKLDWMNGVHLRALPPEEYAAALLDVAARAGLRLARRSSCARPRRSCRRRSSSSAQFPA